MAPPACFVPQLMNELFGWMKEVKNQVHPLMWLPITGLCLKNGM